MISILLSILCVFMFAIIVSLLIYIMRTKSQVKEATAMLDDVAAGNLDRRIIMTVLTELILSTKNKRKP